MRNAARGVVFLYWNDGAGKIVNPDISYAGTPREGVIGGMAVSGVEGYEDYMLTGISGLSVGQKIQVPGSELTDAIKRYWRHGLFSKAQVAVDSIVGDKIYLHFIWHCVHAFRLLIM